MESKNTLIAGAAATLVAAAAVTYTVMGTKKPDSQPSEEATPEKAKKDEFKINKISLRSLAEKYDYFLFDCDGVLWHGEENQIG